FFEFLWVNGRKDVDQGGVITFQVGKAVLDLLQLSHKPVRTLLLGFRLVLPRLNGGFSNPSCVLTYGCEDEGESADDAGQWAGNVENFEHGFSPWSGLIPRMPALEGEPPYVTRERERKGGPLRGPRLIST